MEQEEAGEAELVDQRELLVEPRAHALACGRSDRRSAPRTRARRRGAAGRSPARRRRRSRDSGSRAPRVRSNVEPLGELDGARDRVPVVGEALEHRPAAAASTDSWLPRRSRSQPSSEVRQRTATSTSWSAARRASCACTSPVATVCTRERLGEVAQRRVAARVAALVRALQLDEEAVAAERAARAAPRRSGRARRARAARSRRGRRAPRCSSSSSARVERRRQRLPVPPSAACCACAAVSSRQRFA